MDYNIMREVAFLFVEQYEKLVEAGLLHEYKKPDVDLIRATAEKGEAAMYMVVATIFGPALDQAFLGAAHGGMDYIAYYDEYWDELDTKEKADIVQMAEFHLESVRAVLKLSQRNECTTTQEIMGKCKEAEYHTQRVRERASAEKNS